MEIIMMKVCTKKKVSLNLLSIVDGLCWTNVGSVLGQWTAQHWANVTMLAGFQAILRRN